MTLRYRVALFDLDGTLLDSAADLVASVQYALRQVDGRDPPDPDTIVMEIGKPLETILKELGYPHAEGDRVRFADSYRRHFAARFPDKTRPFPGVIETLDFLRRAGVRLGLVTTKHQAQAEFAVERTGLAGFFHYVHGWKEGRRHKPDPEPIEAAIRELGTATGDALMVGDSEQDILAAQAAGVASCAVAYGFRPVLMLKSLKPDFIIPRITDVVHIVVAEL